MCNSTEIRKNASSGIALLLVAECVMIAAAVIAFFFFGGADETVITFVAAGLAAVFFVLMFAGLSFAGKEDAGFLNARSVLAGVFAAQIFILILNLVKLFDDGIVPGAMIISIFDIVMMVMIFNSMKRLCNTRAGLSGFLSAAKIVYVIVVIMGMAANLG